MHHEKVELSNSCMKWYAEKVCAAMKENGNNVKAAVASIQPDLRLSVLKPIHATWVISSFNALEEKTDLIISGWRCAGVISAVEKGRQPDSSPAPAKKGESPTPVEKDEFLSPARTDELQP